MDGSEHGSGQQPQTTIPAFPEVTLTGMKQQLMPRILECSQGGYIVIFDGHGISAVSSFAEVIEKIGEVGCGVFNEQFQPDLPNVAMDGPDFGDPPRAFKREINLKRLLHVFAATVATCLWAAGIKIA